MQHVHYTQVLTAVVELQHARYCGSQLRHHATIAKLLTLAHLHMQRSLATGLKVVHYMWGLFQDHM